MRGYGNCAPHCLGWQSSAPVQGSPSHHCMQWAGVLPVACGVPRLSLPLPAGFGAVPSSKGRRRARGPSVAARDPALVAASWAVALSPADGMLGGIGGISGTTLGCHTHWYLVEFLSSSSSSQDLPHPLLTPSVLLMA